MHVSQMKRHHDLTEGGISRPLASLKLNTVFLLGLSVPLSLLGSKLWAVAGVFVGLATASNIAGAVALWYGRRYITTQALAASSPSLRAADWGAQTK